jgi:hypothetical protein
LFINEFKSITDNNKDLIQKLVDNYIKENSSSELKISDETKKNIIIQLNDNNLTNIFKKAYEESFSKLNEDFIKFKNTENYKNYVNKELNK